MPLALEVRHRYRKMLGTISRGLTIGRSRYAARHIIDPIRSQR